MKEDAVDSCVFASSQSFRLIHVAGLCLSTSEGWESFVRSAKKVCSTRFSRLRLVIHLPLRA